MAAAIQNIKAEFDKVDANHDGAITLAELKAAYATLGKPAALAESTFQKMDRDKSGTLSFEEFCFGYYDADNDGCISPAELANIFQQIGKTPAEAKAVFANMDRNGDGTISFEEFQFGLIDLNGDGKLTLEEVVTVYQKLHRNPADAVALFQKMDRDKSGSITFDEYCFGLFDVDGDGKVTLREMKAFYKKMGKNPAEGVALFKKLDRDHNGSVSFDEYQFGMFDANGDGEVTLPELQAFYKLIGKNPAEAVPFFNKCDRNHDGSICFDEYMFCLFDLDGDGKVTLPEFTAYLVKQGKKPADAVHIFNRIDKDGSGSICYDEYCFAAFDANGDGKVTLPELERYYTLRGKNPADALALFNRIDRNHDGSITYDEYSFALIDADGDGKLTKAELAAYFAAKGKPAAEANALFDAMDRDHSGHISFDEYSFGLFDINHDGKVTLAEFQRFFGRSAEATALFNKMDKNKDGSICYDEYVFGLLDDNGDGKVTLAELQQFYLRVGKDPLAAVALFNAIDRNHDGSITYDEYIFGLMDANGDGKLSLAELKAFLHARGRDVSAVDAVFAKMDKDKSGSISFAEFCFGLIDSNNDGKLSVSEFQAFYGMLGKDPRECIPVFYQLDTDGDRAISFTEFSAWAF